MAERPLTRVEFRTFTGQHSNSDPHDVPKGGFVALTNLGCQVPGQLTVRKGARALTFAVTAAATSAVVRTMIYMGRPEAKFIVYTDSFGNVKAGRTPT